MAPLIEWASHGILVIADGSPTGSGRDTSALLKKGLDWAVANAGKGNYSTVDASRVGVAGQSCGGLLAYDLESDRRVTALGIFNSGALNAQQRRKIPSFTKPIAYFLGGKSDIAWAQVWLADSNRSRLTVRSRELRTTNLSKRTWLRGRETLKQDTAEPIVCLLVANSVKQARNGGDGNSGATRRRRPSLPGRALSTWDGRLCPRI